MILHLYFNFQPGANHPHFKKLSIMKKKFNPYILLLPIIIAVIFYWVSYEEDNYPVTNHEIVMK